MIQDIFPYKLNNHYDPEIKISNDDRVICMNQNRILVHAAKMKEHVLDFPKMSELGENKIYKYLFSVEKEKIYLLTFLSTKIIFLLIKNFLMNFSKIKKFTTKGIVSVLLEFL